MGARASERADRAYIIRRSFVSVLKNLKRPPPDPAPPGTLPALAMNNFEEDTVIMAHDATNGIDKPDILADK